MERFFCCRNHWTIVKEHFRSSSTFFFVINKIKTKTKNDAISTRSAFLNIVSLFSTKVALESFEKKKKKEEKSSIDRTLERNETKEKNEMKLV